MHLDRVMTLLETVALAGRPVSAADLHALTGLPRPTCYRLIQTLLQQRLLEDVEGTSRYVVGERMVRIALLAKTDAGISSTIAPALKDAAIDFGEAVFLSRFRGRSVGIIHVETPADPAVSYIHPGLGNRPMHACSCSKAIAAFADATFRNVILDGNMKSYTEHTHTSRAALEQEFATIKQRGFAECVEEIEVGVSSVAAPVQLEQAAAVFSVGTIGPIRRFHQRHRRQLGERLIHLAADVSQALQFSLRFADT